MVLEAQTGLVVALFGILGLTVLLFVPRIRGRPGPWLAFFLGVLLYLIIHDLAEAFLLESALRVSLGGAGTLSLMALGLLMGGAAALVLLQGASDRGVPALGVAALIALLLALHATLDGLVVGIALQTLPEAQIIEPSAIALQAIHRALEGGLLVVVLVLAGVRANRTLAGLVFVSLPLVAGAALAPLTPNLIAASVSVLLGFMAAGAFFVLLLRGSWVVLAEDIGSFRAVPWLLVGFLIGVIAHNLAH